MPATSEPGTLRPVQTAKSSETIWSKICQDDFRRDLVALEKCTNAVPIDVLTAKVKAVAGESQLDASLPLHVEKQVADDLAYISAVSEGAQSVAAVCLEQHVRTTTSGERSYALVFKIAGMDIVQDDVKNMLREVANVLQNVSRRTMVNRKQEHGVSADTIFQAIVEKHTHKLLGRLRSKKWIKPTYLDRTHKKPLWRDFANVIHRVQHIYPKKYERKTRDTATTHLSELARVYETFESSDDENDSALQALVRATYEFCTMFDIKAYAAKLESASQTPQIGAALKTMRQLEKIGAYWRVAQDLVTTATKYANVCQDIRIEYITPYASIPTEITYESWAGKCHVHAEVQLAVEYAMQEDTVHSDDSMIIAPRTIGTSKYLCYLCYLFLCYYGGFVALSTHGRLYDQWTVPDLAEFGIHTRQKIASVLEKMNQHLKRQIEETNGVVWRPEPMTSRQNLLCFVDEAETVDELDHELGRFTLG